MLQPAPHVIDGKLTPGEYDDGYKKCAIGESGALFGGLYISEDANYVYVALLYDNDFDDNTYGVTAVGWEGVGGRPFDKVVGSDHGQFVVTDGEGATVLQFKVDLISIGKNGPYDTPSGFGTTGVGKIDGKGDGEMIIGDPAHIVAVGTSIDYNLNLTGYCYNQRCDYGTWNLADSQDKNLGDSPYTDSFYHPNPEYPDWIYEVIFEVQIDKAAFGAAGFGDVNTPCVHASPNKPGLPNNYCTIEWGGCLANIGDWVWYDANENLQQDDGSTGIDGILLNLYSDNGDLVFDPYTDAISQTTTTVDGGWYDFQNVPPGNYFVDVFDNSVPTGYELTTNNDPTSLISVVEDDDYNLADFGYYHIPAVHVTGGGVYEITSTATNADGSSTTVESHIRTLDWTWLFDYAISSVYSVQLQPTTVVDGDVIYGTSITGEENIQAPHTATHDPDIRVNWPMAETLAAFYLRDVEGLPPLGDTIIDVGVTSSIGPLYIDGNLDIKNTGGVMTATLAGTVYVTGDLAFEQPGGGSNAYTIDLNGHTIYVEGSISFPPQHVSISGSGCIIAKGDVDFQPAIASGPGDFVFVMSVEGTTEMHPNGDFYGSVAGDTQVQLQPGCTLTRTDPPSWLNFPKGDTLEILTYTIRHH